MWYPEYDNVRLQWVPVALRLTLLIGDPSQSIFEKMNSNFNLALRKKYSCQYNFFLYAEILWNIKVIL